MKNSCKAVENASRRRICIYLPALPLTRFCDFSLWTHLWLEFLRPCTLALWDLDFSVSRAPGPLRPDETWGACGPDMPFSIFRCGPARSLPKCAVTWDKGQELLTWPADGRRETGDGYGPRQGGFTVLFLKREYLIFTLNKNYFWLKKKLLRRLFNIPFRWLFK